MECNKMIKCLKEVMKHRKNVRPQQEECDLLQEECGDYFSNLSLHEWFDIVPKELLFCDSNDSFDDQLTRATELIQAIIKKPTLSNIHLFDGHGRFLYAFLYAYFEAQLKGDIPITHDIYFIFYDCEVFVDRWHRLFFPNKSVKCVYGNVFKFMYQLLMDNSLVYLNFCGLGASIDCINTQCKLPWLKNFSQQEKAMWMIDSNWRSMENFVKQSGWTKDELYNSLYDALNSVLYNLDPRNGHDAGKDELSNSLHDPRELFRIFLNILPKDYLPNQINLLDLLSRYMVGSISFELMISFDVSGVIRKLGRRSFSRKKYHNPTFIVWKLLDEKLGTLVTSRNDFVTYIVRESSRSLFKCMQKEIIFRSFVENVTGYGVPSTQYSYKIKAYGTGINSSFYKNSKSKNDNASQEKSINFAKRKRGQGPKESDKDFFKRASFW